MSIIKKAALYFARKEFCKDAINERADLAVLRQKHTLPEKIGIFLIVFSFVIVIPSFFIVGLIAADLKKPMVGIIGIPLAYGISWIKSNLVISYPCTGMALKSFISPLLIWPRITVSIRSRFFGSAAKMLSSSSDKQF